MTTHAYALAERYIASWNETDALRRRNLIEDVYNEHARYTDPMVDAKGWEAIDATVAAVQNMFPGHRFALAGDVDAHHDTLRFQWHLAAPGADEPLVIGFDVASLQDGRIGQVFGFLDKVPQMA
ncbi:nuclear transport factor 2 family protein [Dyella jiangningensis]|uniref:nuclear transport factor 2 family protein n=1 Tax=Dyella jiangningensis TaxID=1379159 RepID=UPI00240F3515|nr:nuclear transport factor 2 family protein [Dyella jiangningensis]MDG2538099.1 nuclear transport factor 2 family protein [Dyella jiangningensis]